MITNMNKRLLIGLLFISCNLLFSVSVMAQTITNGSKWWDGSVLYTAKVAASGDVTMNGIDAHEGGFRFMLSKDPSKQGRYTLTTDNPDAYMPYVAMTLFNMALLYANKGELADAEEKAKESLEKFQRMAALSHAAYDKDVENATNLLAGIQAAKES